MEYPGGEKTLHFFSKERRPHIKELISLSIDPITLEGVVHFDGYYYVDDAELPKQQMMSYRHYACEGETRTACLEALDAEVEIYRREKVKDTSTFWMEKDEDGSEMNICLFPTDLQKMYFKVLKIIKDDRMVSVAPVQEYDEKK